MTAYACTFPRFSAVAVLPGDERVTVLESSDPDDAYDAFLSTAAYVGVDVKAALYTADEVTLSAVVLG